jgi:hypothetical protein
MATINSTYTVYYVADQLTSGLTDVQLKVTHPDGTVHGLYVMLEKAGNLGVYYYDYPLTQLGQYLFVANSASYPAEYVKSLDVGSSTFIPTAEF